MGVSKIKHWISITFLRDIYFQNNLSLAYDWPLIPKNNLWGPNPHQEEWATKAVQPPEKTSTPQSVSYIAERMDRQYGLTSGPNGWPALHHSEIAEFKTDVVIDFGLWTIHRVHV